MIELMEIEMLTCKCCGNEARWCGDGKPGDSSDEPHNCDHIHCDHCGMHYSLESEASKEAGTFEDARALNAGSV